MLAIDDQHVRRLGVVSGTGSVSSTWCKGRSLIHGRSPPIGESLEARSYVPKDRAVATDRVHNHFRQTHSL